MSLDPKDRQSRVVNMLLCAVAEVAVAGGVTAAEVGAEAGDQATITRDRMKERRVVTKVTCRTGRHDDVPSGGVTTMEAHPAEGVGSVEVTEGVSEVDSGVDTVVVMEVAHTGTMNTSMRWNMKNTTAVEVVVDDAQDSTGVSTAHAAGVTTSRVTVATKETTNPSVVVVGDPGERRERTEMHPTMSTREITRPTPQRQR